MKIRDKEFLPTQYFYQYYSLNNHNKIIDFHDGLKNHKGNTNVSSNDLRTLNKGGRLLY